MEVHLQATELLNALKRFKPSGKTKPFREPTVHVVAQEHVLTLSGSFDNHLSIAVEMLRAGCVDLPLDMSLRLLSTYKLKEPVRIRAVGNDVWFDAMRIRLTEKDSGAANLPGRRKR